jgi:ribokinase
VLLLQCEIPIHLSAEAARLAHAQGMTVIFNASPVPANPEAIPVEMWRSVDVLLVNRTEAELLSGMPVTGAPEAECASDALQRRFGVPTVIVTLGGDGVVARDGHGSHYLLAWPIEVVETIGAGDAFAGVLASELARGLTPSAALLLANAAGALAATRPGAHDALPTGEEIRAFLRDRQHADI